MLCVVVPDVKAKALRVLQNSFCSCKDSKKRRAAQLFAAPACSTAARRLSQQKRARAKKRPFVVFHNQAAMSLNVRDFLLREKTRRNAFETCFFAFLYFFAFLAQRVCNFFARFYKFLSIAQKSGGAVLEMRANVTNWRFRAISQRKRAKNRKHGAIGREKTCSHKISFRPFVGISFFSYFCT